MDVHDSVRRIRTSTVPCRSVGRAMVPLEEMPHMVIYSPREAILAATHASSTPQLSSFRAERGILALLGERPAPQPGHQGFLAPLGMTGFARSPTRDSGNTASGRYSPDHLLDG